MSVAGVDIAIKSSMKSTYRQSVKDLKAVDVPSKSVNKKGIKESKISTELLSSKELPVQGKSHKSTYLVGTIELPLKSKHPISGLSAMKKQTKKGFYHTNNATNHMASSRSLSSKSKRRTHHTREGSTTPLVKSKREDHKLSKSKEYDMKIREQNRRSQKSIIKSAQRILYSSRSHKNHENSGMKSQDAQSTVQAQSVSSFVQTKTENDKNSPFKSTFEANHNFDHHEGKDPKGAIRVKPEGSLCAHRKGYKPTPADLECTFKPSINKQSRFLDEKKFRGGVSPTAAVPRYDNLLNKGSEYAEHRKKLAFEQQTREAIKEEQACSFRPARIAHYQPITSNELPIEARSNAWQKRRDDKLNKQRQDLQRRAEEELIKEGIIPKRSDRATSKETSGKKFSRGNSKGSPDWESYKIGPRGEITPKRGTISDDEYMNIRLDCIRRSIEKQMSYADSQRSRSKSKD